MSTIILTANATQQHKDAMLAAWAQEATGVSGWFFPTEGVAVSLTNLGTLTYANPTSTTVAGKPARQRQAAAVTLTVNTASGTTVNRVVVSNADPLTDPGAVQIPISPALEFPDGGSIVVNHVRVRVIDAT